MLCRPCVAVRWAAAHASSEQQVGCLKEKPALPLEGAHQGAFACLCRPRLQGVPETTHFAPHVRYEIGAFGWYLVDHLPGSYEESKQVGTAGSGQARLHSGPACHSTQPRVPQHARRPTRPGAWLPMQAFVNEQGGRHRFFNVWPYVKPLRAWIK